MDTAPNVVCDPRDFYSGEVYNMSGGKSSKDLTECVAQYTSHANSNPQSLFYCLIDDAEDQQQSQQQRQYILGVTCDNEAESEQTFTPYVEKDWLGCVLARVLGTETVSTMRNVNNIFYSFAFSADIDLDCDITIDDTNHDHDVNEEDFRRVFDMPHDVMGQNVVKSLVARIGHLNTVQPVKHSKLFKDLVDIITTWDGVYQRYVQAAREQMQNHLVNSFVGGRDTVPEAPFKYCLLTNVSLKGLKIVLYPSGLEDLLKPENENIEPNRLLSLFSYNMECLKENVPVLMDNLNVMCHKFKCNFKMDGFGDKNAMLPGHAKSTLYSLPYHHLSLIRDSVTQPKRNNTTLPSLYTLRLSNKYVVTSVGPIPCNSYPEWRKGFVRTCESFVSSSSFYTDIRRPASLMYDHAWRRHLIETIGSDLILRNNDRFMSPDMYFCMLAYMAVIDEPNLVLSNLSRDELPNMTDISEKAAKEGKRGKTYRNSNNTLKNLGMGEDSLSSSKKKKKKKGSETEMPYRNPRVAQEFNNIVKVTEAKLSSKGLTRFWSTSTDRESVVKIFKMNKTESDKFQSSATGFKKIKLTFDHDSTIYMLTNTTSFKSYGMETCIAGYMYDTLLDAKADNRISMDLNTLSYDDLADCVIFKKYEDIGANESLIKTDMENGSEVVNEDDGEVQDKKTVVELPKEFKNVLFDYYYKNYAQKVSSTNILQPIGGIVDKANEENVVLAWLLITLSERFCIMYNMLCHPEEVHRLYEEENMLYRGKNLNHFVKYSRITKNRIDGILFPDGIKKTCLRCLDCVHQAREEAKVKMDWYNNIVINMKFRQSVIKRTHLMHRNARQKKEMEVIMDDEDGTPSGEPTNDQEGDNYIPMDLEAMSMDTIEEFCRLFVDDWINEKSPPKTNRSTPRSQDDSDIEEGGGGNEERDDGYEASDDDDKSDYLGCSIFDNNYCCDEDREENPGTGVGSSSITETLDIINLSKSVKSQETKMLLCHDQQVYSKHIMDMLGTFFGGMINMDPGVVTKGSSLIKEKNTTTTTPLLSDLLNSNTSVPRTNSEKGLSNRVMNIGLLKRLNNKIYGKFFIPFSTPETIDNRDLTTCCCGKKNMVLTNPQNVFVENLCKVVRFNTYSLERSVMYGCSLPLGFCPKKNVDFIAKENPLSPNIDEPITLFEKEESTCPSTNKKKTKTVRKQLTRAKLNRCTEDRGELLRQQLVKGNVGTMYDIMTLERDLADASSGWIYNEFFKNGQRINKEATPPCPDPTRCCTSFEMTLFYTIFNMVPKTWHVDTVLRPAFNTTFVDLLKEDTIPLIGSSNMKTLQRVKNDMDRRGSSVFANACSFVDGHFVPLTRNLGQGHAFMFTALEQMEYLFKTSLPLNLTTDIDWLEGFGASPNVCNLDEGGSMMMACRFIKCLVTTCFGNIITVHSTERGIRNLYERRDHRIPEWVREFRALYDEVLASNNATIMMDFISSSEFLSSNMMDKKMNLDAKTSKEQSSMNVYQRYEMCERANGGMTFTNALLAYCCFRLFFEKNVTTKELFDHRSKTPVSCAAKTMITFYRFVFNSWPYSVPESSEKPAWESLMGNTHFPDIDNDPFYFYRFMAFSLGYHMTTEHQVHTTVTGITNRFDANTLDSSRWSDMLRIYPDQLIMGKRARMLSFPCTFFKNIISASMDIEKELDIRDDNEYHAKQQREAASRVAKLMLSKRALNQNILDSDVLYACHSAKIIHTDPKEGNHDNFDWRTIYDFENKFYSEHATVKNSELGRSFTGNAMTCEILQKIKSKENVLDTSVDTWKPEFKSEILSGGVPKVLSGEKFTHDDEANYRGPGPSNRGGRSSRGTGRDSVLGHQNTDNGNYHHLGGLGAFDNTKMVNSAPRTTSSDNMMSNNPNWFDLSEDYSYDIVNSSLLLEDGTEVVGGGEEDSSPIISNSVTCDINTNSQLDPEIIQKMIVNGLGDRVAVLREELNEHMMSGHIVYNPEVQSPFYAKFKCKKRRQRFRTDVEKLCSLEEVGKECVSKIGALQKFFAISLPKTDSCDTYFAIPFKGINAWNKFVDITSSNLIKKIQESSIKHVSFEMVTVEDAIRTGAAGQIQQQQQQQQQPQVMMGRRGFGGAFQRGRGGFRSGGHRGGRGAGLSSSSSTFIPPPQQYPFYNSSSSMDCNGVVRVDGMASDTNLNEPEYLMDEHGTTSRVDILGEVMNNTTTEGGYNCHPNLGKCRRLKYLFPQDLDSFEGSVDSVITKKIIESISTTTDTGSSDNFISRSSFCRPHFRYSDHAEKEDGIITTFDRQHNVSEMIGCMENDACKPMIPIRPVTLCSNGLRPEDQCAIFKLYFQRDANPLYLFKLRSFIGWINMFGILDEKNVATTYSEFKVTEIKACRSVHDTEEKVVAFCQAAYTPATPLRHSCMFMGDLLRASIELPQDRSIKLTDVYEAVIYKEGLLANFLQREIGLAHAGMDGEKHLYNIVRKRDHDKVCKAKVLHQTRIMRGELDPTILDNHPTAGEVVASAAAAADSSAASSSTPPPQPQQQRQQQQQIITPSHPASGAPPLYLNKGENEEEEVEDEEVARMRRRGIRIIPLPGCAYTIERSESKYGSLELTRHELTNKEPISLSELEKDGFKAIGLREVENLFVNHLIKYGYRDKENAPMVFKENTFSRTVRTTPHIFSDKMKGKRQKVRQTPGYGTQTLTQLWTEKMDMDHLLEEDSFLTIVDQIMHYGNICSLKTLPPPKTFLDVSCVRNDKESSTQGFGQICGDYIGLNMYGFRNPAGRILQEIGVSMLRDSQLERRKVYCHGSLYNVFHPEFRERFLKGHDRPIGTVKFYDVINSVGSKIKMMGQTPHGLFTRLGHVFTQSELINRPGGFLQSVHEIMGLRMEFGLEHRRGFISSKSLEELLHNPNLLYDRKKIRGFKIFKQYLDSEMSKVRGLESGVGYITNKGVCISNTIPDIVSGPYILYSKHVKSGNLLELSRGYRNKSERGTFLNPLVVPYQLSDYGSSDLLRTCFQQSVSMAFNTSPCREKKSLEAKIKQGDTLKLESKSSGAPFVAEISGGRYLVIGGNIILGGHILEESVVIDTMTTNSLSIELKLIVQSMMSNNFQADALITSIEGSSAMTGLGLCEYTRGISESDRSYFPSASEFWFDKNLKNKEELKHKAEQQCRLEMDSRDLIPTFPSTSSSLSSSSSFSPYNLKPPSVHNPDQDYVFLNSVYHLLTSQSHRKGTNEHLLKALERLYLKMVDQKTGICEPELVFFVRFMQFFGGFMNVTSSGNSTQAHHLFHCLCVIGLNRLHRAALVFIGLDGMNGKSWLIDILKYSFMRNAIKPVLAEFLCMKNMNASNAQANLKDVVGTGYTTITIDECGYSQRYDDNPQNKDNGKQNNGKISVGGHAGKSSTTTRGGEMDMTNMVKKMADPSYVMWDELKERKVMAKYHERDDQDSKQFEGFEEDIIRDQHMRVSGKNSLDFLLCQYTWMKDDNKGNTLNLSPVSMGRRVIKECVSKLKKLSKSHMDLTNKIPLVASNALCEIGRNSFDKALHTLSSLERINFNLRSIRMMRNSIIFKSLTIQSTHFKKQVSANMNRLARLFCFLVDCDMNEKEMRRLVAVIYILCNPRYGLDSVLLADYLHGDTDFRNSEEIKEIVEGYRNVQQNKSSDYQTPPDTMTSHVPDFLLTPNNEDPLTFQNIEHLTLFDIENKMGEHFDGCVDCKTINDIKKFIDFYTKAFHKMHRYDPYVYGPELDDETQLSLNEISDIEIMHQQMVLLMNNAGVEYHLGGAFDVDAYCVCNATISCMEGLYTAPLKEVISRILLPNPESPFLKWISSWCFRTNELSSEIVPWKRVKSDDASNFMTLTEESLTMDYQAEGANPEDVAISTKNGKKMKSRTKLIHMNVFGQGSFYAMHCISSIMCTSKRDAFIKSDVVSSNDRLMTILNIAQEVSRDGSNKRMLKIQRGYSDRRDVGAILKLLTRDDGSALDYPMYCLFRSGAKGIKKTIPTTTKQQTEYKTTSKKQLSSRVTFDANGAYNDDQIEDEEEREVGEGVAEREGIDRDEDKVEWGEDVEAEASISSYNVLQPKKYKPSQSKPPVVRGQFNSNLVKQILSKGEGSIRGNYENPKETPLSMQMIICSNQHDLVFVVDEATNKRLIRILFDTKLKYREENENSAIISEIMRMTLNRGHALLIRNRARLCGNRYEEIYASLVIEQIEENCLRYLPKVSFKSSEDWSVGLKQLVTNRMEIFKTYPVAMDLDHVKTAESALLAFSLFVGFALTRYSASTSEAIIPRSISSSSSSSSLLPIFEDDEEEGDEEGTGEDAMKKKCDYKKAMRSPANICNGAAIYPSEYDVPCFDDDGKDQEKLEEVKRNKAGNFVISKSTFNSKYIKKYTQECLSRKAKSGGGFSKRPEDVIRDNDPIIRSGMAQRKMMANQNHKQYVGISPRELLTNYSVIEQQKANKMGVKVKDDVFISIMLVMAPFFPSLTVNYREYYLKDKCMVVELFDNKPTLNLIAPVYVPNPDMHWPKLSHKDMGINGYGDTKTNFNKADITGSCTNKKNTIPIFEVATKWLVAWGSKDVRDLVYPCHHIHILYELTKRHLGITSDFVRNNMKVDVFAESMIITYFSQISSIFSGRDVRGMVDVCSTRKRRYHRPENKDILLYPIFCANEELELIMEMPNLAKKTEHILAAHRRILSLLDGIGFTIEREYLCPDCKRGQ